MSKASKFEDLEIFQSARKLCKEVYEITKGDEFHKDIRFVQQIHASAGSVMDNIAEGFERDGNKEYVNFLYIAKGSCGEPTYEASAEISSLNLCLARRRKTLVKSAVKLLEHPMLVSLTKKRPHDYTTTASTSVKRFQLLLIVLSRAAIVASSI